MATVIEYFLNAIVQATNKLTYRKSSLDFINSNYKAQDKEVYVQQLKVIGQLPKELDGAYIRNGPNNKYFVDGKTHLYEGDGMLHSIRFKNGEVIAYNNHFVRTDQYKANEKYGHSVNFKFAQLRGWTMIIYSTVNALRQRFGIIKSTKPKEVDDGHTNQANINVYYIAGKLLALHEADLPHQIRLLCNGILETIGYIKVGESRVVTAHPHTDIETNETFYFRHVVQKPLFMYGYVDSKGYSSKLVNIDLRYPAMAHDFSITKKYAIFFELPLFMDGKTMMQQNVLPYQFKKDLPARFGVLPRYAKSQDEITWFELPSQFIFHVCNSWDIEGQNAIKMYACRYEEFSLEEGFVGVTKSEKEYPAHLCEYTFNLDTKTATEKVISNERIEFPQINQRYMGKKNRYIYTTQGEFREDIPHQAGFVKYDVSDPTNLKKEIIKFGPNIYGGELYFAPKYEDEKRQATLDEDNGFLMGYTHNYVTQQSSFVVYDAKLRSKEPLAEVILPQRVPFGFHGAYFNSEQLANQATTKENIELSPY